MYLNRVYFGSGSYGVEAASRRYFGKSARDVTLSEAALLAGLLKAPSKLSPARDPKAAEDARAAGARRHARRRHDRREGAGDRDERSGDARRLLLDRLGKLCRRPHHGRAPGLIGETRADIIVDTTIDLDLQKLAEKSIRRLIDENGKKLNVSQGALVSIDSTGAVRAMVGGYDYANSQFDRASEAQAPARLGLQAVRLSGGTRTGPHAGQRAQRRADQDRQLDARQLPRQILWPRDAGDGARQIAEFGRRPAGHGGRPGQCRRDGASHGHRIRTAGQHIDRARHVRGDAAGADRRLRSLRQWRLQAGRAFHQAYHHRSRRRALREQAQQHCRASSGPRSSA